MDRPSESSCRDGFTLIEVLVVVAIIALLIAILAPSLRQARRQSQSIACLSNLRQIGMGMQTYARDHRGRLPAGPADQLVYMNLNASTSNAEFSQERREGGGWRPVMLTPWQWGGKRAEWKYLEDTNGNAKEETLVRPLTRQIYRTAGLDSHTPVFNCPGDDGLDYWDRPHAGAWQRGGLGRRPIHALVGNSYYVHLWNTNSSDGTKIQGLKKRPGEVVLTYEGILYYNHFVPDNPFLPPLPASVRGKGWHSNDRGYNILFLDGHGEHCRFPKAAGSTLNSKGVVFANYAEIMDCY